MKENLNNPLDSNINNSNPTSLPNVDGNNSKVIHTRDGSVNEDAVRRYMLSQDDTLPSALHRYSLEIYENLK